MVEQAKGPVRSFYVTTTENFTDYLKSEILRVDPEASITVRRDNKTLFLVKTARMNEWTLESISCVAHAVNISALGLKVA